MNVHSLTARCTKCGEIKPVRAMEPVVTPTEYNGTPGYSAYYVCKECEPPTEKTAVADTPEDMATRECTFLAEHRRRHG